MFLYRVELWLLSFLAVINISTTTSGHKWAPILWLRIKYLIMKSHSHRHEINLSARKFVFQVFLFTNFVVYFLKFRVVWFLTLSLSPLMIHYFVIENLFFIMFFLFYPFSWGMSQTHNQGVCQTWKTAKTLNWELMALKTLKINYF